MDQNTLPTAENILLNNQGLEISDIHTTLDKVMEHQVDQADIYFQSACSESWMLEDGIIREGSYNLDQGVGIRAISGEKTGFAYADEIVRPALIKTAQSARAIASHGQQHSVQAWHKKEITPLYDNINPASSITVAEKIDLLKQLDQLARKQDNRVKQVFISLSSSHSVILVANNHGILATDIRPLVRLNINVIVEHNKRIEKGGSGGGGRYGYDYFITNNVAHQYVEEAVQLALTNLEATAAPAGSMPVVLGHGWPGILLHEAIGHGLEGDFNRKQTSAFSGRMGEAVASPAITIVDNGTIANRRGSLNVDDEGTPTQCTTLIEQGILKNYMQDNMNARLTNTTSTGNGRRESYAHLPMPRMTNTYMLNGQHSPDEIISSVKRGLYATQFDGGQVDITNGKFVFSASQSFMIEDGKITTPIKGATLIGNGPDVLTKVSMVGNDMSLDSGIGTCGKDGQSVPVGVGQPTILIDDLTVGGTNL